MKEKFIIISFDAIGDTDFNNLISLPNFKSFLNDCSYSNQVTSVYPSLTYPAHTSISTGKLPINHGVTNNILVQPERLIPDWFWYRKYINGTTIYDAAKTLGFRTCSLLWPVTGKAKSIDLNLPEIFPNRKYHNQILVSALSGSALFQAHLESHYGKLRKGFEQPYLDNFTFNSLMHVLNNDLADFILVHLTDTDAHKHIFGCNNPHVFQSLKRHDNRLGIVLKFLKDNNIYENSTLICLGDHNLKDVQYAIKLNRLFVENKLITLVNNKITDFKAYSNFCDGSAYIYVNDKSYIKQVYDLLKDFSLKNNNCIKEILCTKQAGEIGASNKCTFMLEANEGYYFINDYTKNIIESTYNNHSKATHGYNPNIKDYKTLFFCKSPKVKKNFNIGPMHLIDEGATIFELLDYDITDIDGKILNNIFI